MNTDSGPLTDRAFGDVKALTLEQRYAKAIGAGSNIFSDVSDSAGLVSAIQQGLLKESDLTTSVRLLLVERFALDCSRTRTSTRSRHSRSRTDPPPRRRRISPT